MTQMHLIHDLAVVAAGLAFWACFLWPLVVRPFWAWHRSAWGWNMAIKVELIAVALFPGILVTEFGIRPGIGLMWAEVAAIFAIPCVLTWRTAIIWHGQRRREPDSVTEYAAPAADRERDADTAS